MAQNRRSAGRRRAWGRGPITLRYDSLEKRELLSAAPHGLPDLVGSSFVTVQNADWGDSERLVVNVDTIYAGLDPAHKKMNAVEAFREMARYRAR